MGKGETYTLTALSTVLTHAICGKLRVYGNLPVVELDLLQCEWAGKYLQHSVENTYGDGQDM